MSGMYPRSTSVVVAQFLGLILVGVAEKSIRYGSGCNDYISPLCVSTNKSVC